MANSPLTILATYLAGEFENQTQAAADPAWYVRLRLWQVPVPSLSSERICTLFLEQANVISQEAPYRQRILQLTENAGGLWAQYFALSQPLTFRGAGTHPDLLESLSAADLIALPNSTAPVQYRGAGEGYLFQAKLPDGQLCSFEYGDQRRYVYLGFDVALKGEAVELLIYDKGVDPDTGRGLWGALMGPFCMVKQKRFDWPASPRSR